MNNTVPQPFPSIAVHSPARLVRRRRAISLVYITFMLSILLGFASLAIDWGRVQLAKCQLQHAADAAARFGAVGLENGASAARANAVAAAAENAVDGASVVLDPNLDMQFGDWDTSGRVFTPSAAGAEDSATAVRISIHRTTARNGAIPLTFGQLVGKTTCDVNATSTATYSRGSQVAMGIPGTSNIWLAGMPAETIANPGNPHNNPDVAGDAANPAQSPIAVSALSLTPGQVLTFDSINGGANNFQTAQLFTPDGNTGWITDNLGGAEHGKSDATAPINAVMGVFLGSASPAGTTPPPNLDFGTQQSRDFQTLAPQVQQIFFIGDGRRDNGSTQQFVVPPGATRLFIGTMDQYEWNNNVGSYTVIAHRLGRVTLVK